MEFFSPKIINAGVILTRQKFTRSLINADEMFFQAKNLCDKTITWFLLMRIFSIRVN